LLDVSACKVWLAEIEKKKVLAANSRLSSNIYLGPPKKGALFINEGGIL
jgi:hypothetical protein